jgi:4-amino-4-deoxy-L-arabinose transferase-like glycosyltransferase
MPSTNERSSRQASALLLVFTCFAAGLLGYFEWRDGRPFTYDDAWYMETSLRLFDALAEGRWLSFVHEYCGSFGGTKAPLIAVAPLPFFLLLGRQLDPTFLVNAAFLFLSSIYLYALARRWYSPAVGLLSVVVFQTFPVIAGLARWYLTEYGLAALVIVFLYYLEASDELRSPGANLALGITLGLGLLMKVLFPAFVLGPLLLTWLARRDPTWLAPRAGPARPVADIVEQQPARPSGATGRQRSMAAFAATYPLCFIGLTGALIAASWYALNLGRVLSFAWVNLFGNVADDYRPPMSSWLRALPQESVSLYYALALAAFGLAALFILWKRGELRWRRRHAFLLAWFAPAAIALLSPHNNAVRFAAPGLAVLAILLARSMLLTISAVSRRQLVQAPMLAATLALPLSAFAAITLGAPGLAGELYRSTYWYRPPDQEGQWNQQRVLDALRKLAPAQQQDYNSIIGVEHPYLNANLLNYLSQREHGMSAFAGFGYADNSVERAVRRISEPQVHFLLMADGFSQSELPAFLNRVNAQVRRLLDSHRLPFRYRSTVRLTGRIELRIYERQE